MNVSKKYIKCIKNECIKKIKQVILIVNLRGIVLVASFVNMCILRNV